ncbi:MAG: HEAT repeat domain-containing protein [Armatimonadota bacterium]|nr:MAG: HEAT repeat domain-containing protein [Armatimonadota bacterium]
MPALQELAKHDPEYVASLLRGGDPSVSLMAGEALGRVGRTFQKDLLAAAHDPEVSARLAGVAGLAEAAAAGCEEAVEGLAGRLNDPDGQVRWAAGAALGRARRGSCAGRAVLWLERAIASGEERALSGAAFGAAQLWRSRKRDAVKLMLKAADAGAAGRRAAAAAMRELPRRAAVPVAERCVEDEDPDVRALAAAALGEWAKDENDRAWRGLLRLARDASPAVGEAAAEALLRGAIVADRHLVEQLSAHRSVVVRAAVAEAIGRRRDQALAHVLWPLADDGVASVRASAVQALGAMGLTGLVRAAFRDRAPEVRAAAADASYASSRDDVEMLLELSRERDAVVVRAAARAVGRHLSSPRGESWDRLVELACDTGSGGAAAGGMAAALDRDSSSSADVFWQWPVATIAPDVLPEVCRLARTPLVGELARTITRALRHGEEFCNELRDLSAVFAAAGKHTVAEAVSWLAHCAAARSTEDIGEASAAVPDTKSDALSQLAAVGRAAAAGGRARRADARQRHFARALAAIQTCLDQEPTRPEWSFVHHIAGRWRELIQREVESARLPISARLASDCVVAGPEPRILIALENRGSRPISDVSVIVEDTTRRGPDLSPGETVTVEVPLAAAGPGVLAIHGRAEFRAGGERGAADFRGTLTALRPGRLEAATNPYIVGKPLGAESTMFFGRAAELGYIERALESGEGGSVVVLVGQRRTGKTSLLKRLEARLGYCYRPAFVDVQGMLVADSQTFFRQLAERALAGSDTVSMLSDGDSSIANAATGADVVREVADRSDRRVVLLLDEFDDLDAKVSSGMLSEDVFGQLRNLIQHSDNVSLVLAGTHRLEALAGDRWSFLLNLATYQRVGYLLPEEARDVLRVPLSRLGVVCEDAAVSRALALTGCHPYLLQLLGYRLVERCIESAEAAVRTTLVQEVADEVAEQGEIHLRYLWESAGKDGQETLRLLAACEAGLTTDELEESAHSNVASQADVLRGLSRMDLVVQEADRWKLRIGLLGRWLMGYHSPSMRGRL